MLKSIYFQFMKIVRKLDIVKAAAQKTVLLLGPRQTGKSTLLKSSFPQAPYYNLLHTDVFFKFQRDPSLLRQEVRALGKGQTQPIIIDEIQKLPILLDEVQSLIDEEGCRFILTGSSARKLKAGSANLLGGRARLRQMFPFVSAEVPDFSLAKALSRGMLPSVWFSDEPEEDLMAYGGTYLREEIQAEALVRRLEGFSRFLEVAGLSFTQELNYESLARSCGVPARTVREYVSILTDTLIAVTLEPWQRGSIRKPVSTAKLYFFDLAVARILGGRPAPQMGSQEWGLALESLIFQELRAWLGYENDQRKLTYWRTRDHREVDFIVGDDWAIEVKSTHRVTSSDLSGLRDIAGEGSWKLRILVCSETAARLTDDGILILPVEEFLRRLWSGLLEGPGS